MVPGFLCTIAENDVMGRTASESRSSSKAIGTLCLAPALARQVELLGGPPSLSPQRQRLRLISRDEFIRLDQNSGMAASARKSRVSDSGRACDG